MGKLNFSSLEWMKNYLIQVADPGGAAGMPLSPATGPNSFVFAYVTTDEAGAPNGKSWIRS